MVDKVASEQKTETKKDLWIIYSGVGGAWAGRVVGKTPKSFMIAEGHRIPREKVLCWDVSVEQVAALRDLKVRQREAAENLRRSQRAEVEMFVKALNHEI